ncbi:DUF6990 domain-containing protein [Psychrobacter sp. I-STPA6b]|uniref:DUF6990 domain-containing protein n=1 Tax=Psychrobacter sp. I-STPA6b TaxID=2585718 RepID=UPI001D0C0287|nr:hypothetical protein [Psychrobacter sp. I-STPA6b]
MTKAELYNILIDNGWTIRKGIDDCAYKQLSDRQIQLIPNIKKLIDKYKIIMIPGVSTKEFSKIAEYIRHNKKSRRIVHSCIINSIFDGGIEQGIDVKVPTRQIVEDYLQKIETWAQQQDIEAGLQKYRELPTDSKGTYPVYHLASLAIAGQTTQLAEYLENFKQGNRMGFVPYIKQDYIERALEEAKKHQ